MTRSNETPISSERRSAAAWAIHPGEILKEEFLKPMRLTGYRLAKALDVQPQAISDILLKKRGISADMALRLSKAFGTSAEFWMNLQAAYELVNAKKSLRGKIKRVRPVGNVA
jgi:addiction module HigA family antidote